MKNILADISPSEVLLDPAPHIVIKNAIEESLCSKLIEEFPNLQLLGAEKAKKSNKRLNYTTAEILSSNSISATWKEFVTVNSSREFYRDFYRIFGEHIKRIYPRVLPQAEDSTIGRRKIDSINNCDLLLDALISANSPVIDNASTVRTSHVDHEEKLFFGILYLRQDNDDSKGGDLEIYRYANGKPGGFRAKKVDISYVDVIKTVPYEKNTLVMMLNTINSLHGVTIRQPTKYPRLFANFVGEVQSPLFDPSKYQLEPGTYKISSDTY